MKLFQRRHLCRSLLILLAALAVPARAQDLAFFENRTTVHVLANGWTFVLVERPVVPVISVSTYVDAGSAREVPGITGVAHMLEHMAFKGTTVVGTADYAAERPALERLEAEYRAYQRARFDPAVGAEELEAARERFEAARARAAALARGKEYLDILEYAGCDGISAETSADGTRYFYSLPSHKVELFAYMESERFLRPVFRQFYEERDVVLEERRMRVDNHPPGRLYEQMTAAAFTAHPYGQPTEGYASDLTSLTISDAETFYRAYYTPANIVTAMVGDLDAERLIPMLERYFGRVPAGSPPPALRTVEPPQLAEKTVVLRDRVQPLYAEAYHQAAVTDPDWAVFRAIDHILAGGRGARLPRALIDRAKVAVSLESVFGHPGDKYPGLWGVVVVPARGVEHEAVRAVLRGELERLAEEEVSGEELERFRAHARARLLRSLGGNQGLAHELARHQALFGDWRALFRVLERFDAVTPADVRRVARETFRDSNRTVGMILTAPPPEMAAASAPAP